jgi:hypothetical protein
MMERKHHCRVCGTVACKMCSAKKLPLDPGKKADRLCDGCFNRLIALAQERQVAARKEARTEREYKMTPQGQLGLGLQGSDGIQRREMTDNDQIANIQATGNETLAALEERGEALSELDEASQRLANGAADFSAMTKELARREKEKRGGHNVFGI